MNPKINEMMDVIEQAGDQQVIVWIQFDYEVNKICEILEKEGITFVTLCASTKDKDKSIADFKSGAARILVAHPRSAAHGLTFIKCHLHIFFSMDYSFEAYAQAKARTDRYGQTISTTYVHLIAEDSIDEHIYKALNRKGDMHEKIFEILS